MLNLLEYFNDKKIIVNSIFVRPAKPIVITEQLPFSNITYDFSKITGEYNYYPASVYVKITYGSNEEKSIYRKVISSVLSELSSQDTIKITVEEGNYYKGIYVGSTEIEDKGEVIGTTEIEFRCEPFKISETKYSDELWDTFCFDTDVLGIDSYIVKKNNTIKIVNPGMYTDVLINVNSTLKAKVNDKEMTLNTDENNAIRFKSGENIIQVLEGSGSLNINFYPCYL